MADERFSGDMSRNEVEIDLNKFMEMIQENNELKQKFRPYLDLLYNRNWWKPNKSMSEYITDRYGENGLMGNGDFHPNSGGQRYFYETIIKKLLQPKLI